MTMKNDLFPAFVQLGLSYIRWTQTIPMLMAWGFSILMLLALLVTNYQEQSLSLIAHSYEWLLQWPILGDYLNELAKADSGTFSRSYDTADFQALILKVWAVLSLLLMLLNLLLSHYFGPFPPLRLSTKLKYALLASLLLLAGFLLIYAINRTKFNGGTGGWTEVFGGIAFLTFISSAYSLSIAHALNRFAYQINHKRLSAKPQETIRQIAYRKRLEP